MVKHSRLEVFHIGGDPDAEKMETLNDPIPNNFVDKQLLGDSELLLSGEY